MKSIHMTSRVMVCNVLAASGAIGFFAIAGILSTFFMADPVYDAPLILAVISVGSALFVWSFFRLVRPFGAGRSWQIAELVLVPLYWFPIMLAFTAWISWLGCMQDFQVIVNDLLHWH